MKKILTIMFLFLSLNAVNLAPTKAASTDSFDVFEVFSISEDPNDSISGSTTISDNIKKYADEHTNGNIASAIILRVINVLLLLIGTFAFLVIFYSGILLVTANGDEGKLEKGKNMIVPAILGLVIAFLAYYITVFVQSFFY